MKLATAAALFVTGVALAFGTGASLDSELTQAALLILGLALAVTVFMQVRTSGRPALALGALVLLLGFIRVAAFTDDPTSGWRNVPADGEPIAVSGWLTDDANRAGTGVRLSMHVLEINGDEASFPLTVFASGLSDLTGSGRDSSGFRYGDVYDFSGRFSVSTGRFAEDSAGTVFTGVVSLTDADRGNPLRRAVAGTRDWLARNLGRALSEPSSSLAQTMLVGDRTGLSEDLVIDFRESGTSHILAISGLHIALIGGIALAFSASLFGRRGQYYLLLPLAVTWGYAALAGFSPSVTRAAIMFSVSLMARGLGRQNSSLPAIGFAAAVMVAVSPEILKSLSFQLSFAAIAGISVLTSRITSTADRLVPGLRINEPDSNRLLVALISGIAVSIAATLATWPLIAVNFGGAPVWGGLATVVILPAVPLLIVIGGFAALASGISPPLGEVVGWPAWLLGEFVARVAGFFRGIPPGIISTEGWSAGTAVLVYALIFAVFWWSTVRAWLNVSIRWIRNVTAVPLSERSFVRDGVPVWLVVVATTLAVIAWTGAATASGTDELTIKFFETDRGDMILIRTPNGNSALIDGGRDPLGAVRELDGALPFWDRSLDLLLVTHPDADHIGGLQSVIERYEVDTIAEVPTEHASTVYAAWRRSLDERDDVVVLTASSIIALDDGITLEVLSAGRPFPDASINDASVVTVLRYGGFSMLLTGDITAVTERRLLVSGQDLRATVLKVPHHGSDTSSTRAFLEAVDPEIAIVQVGADNSFGHPTDDVMARIGELVHAENTFVTSQDGDVTVRTDGERVAVTAER